jgi:glycine betaine/proline transport system ATP-binding protein
VGAATPKSGTRLDGNAGLSADRRASAIDSESCTSGDSVATVSRPVTPPSIFRLGDIMPASPPKIEIQNLYKVFGKLSGDALSKLQSGAFGDTSNQSDNVVAVRDVSFSVAEREIFVVMGLSGSGKSTLIRCINRLVEPTAGRVLLDGVDIVGLDKEQLRRVRLEKIAMVFQHFALFPHMTVQQNVEYGLKIQGVLRDDRRSRALEALSLVGLAGWGERMPDQLSGGMRQRVGLARALVVNPEVLLMDEPFGALDPLIRRDMQKELIRIRQRFRGAIIFITHDLHEALTLGDRIAIMRAGRFVQIDAGPEIVAHPADDYVAAFTRDVDRGRVLLVGSVMREARALMLDDTSFWSARAHLLERRDSSVYLVDREGRPAGLLMQQDLFHATAETTDLNMLMRVHFPRTHPSATLVSIYGICRGELPVAVIDPSGRLLGAIDPGDVLSALTDPHEVAGKTEPPTTIDAVESLAQT